MLWTRVNIGVVPEEIEFEVFLQPVQWSSEIGSTADMKK
jgi:hypothetical protein